MNSELVAIARIVRTRGLKGEVVAEVLTDFPERFEGLKNVTAALPNGTRAGLKIENYWFQNDRIVLKFEDCNSVEAGERFRDAEICVRESEVVDLEPDEYFDWQLIGCDVMTLDGKAIGTVGKIMRTGGTEVLEVNGGGKDFLIPFAESICVEVEIGKKRIIVDPPEGLLEF